MSQKTFDISLLTEHFFDLLADIQNQVEVTLTREGVPLARILPLSSANGVIPKAGLNRGSMVMSDDFDEPLSDEFWGL